MNKQHGDERGPPLLTAEEAADAIGTVTSPDEYYGEHHQFVQALRAIAEGRAVVSAAPKPEDERGKERRISGERDRRKEKTPGHPAGAAQGWQPPEGWRLSTCDFSIQARETKPRTNGRVMLIRDPAGYAKWMALTQETKDLAAAPPLYVSGVEMTFADALADACRAALAAAKGDTPNG